MGRPERTPSELLDQREFYQNKIARLSRQRDPNGPLQATLEEEIKRYREYLEDVEIQIADREQCCGAWIRGAGHELGCRRDRS